MVRYLKGCITCQNCSKPRCVFGSPELRARKTFRNWALVIELISEEIIYVCGSELILHGGSEYFGQLTSNPQLTCTKHVEATYYKSRKFDTVCVTCGSSDAVLGIEDVNSKRNQRNREKEINFLFKSEKKRKVFRNLNICALVKNKKKSIKNLVVKTKKKL